jgi:hypothetical protein
MKPSIISRRFRPLKGEIAAHPKTLRHGTIAEPLGSDDAADTIGTQPVSAWTRMVRVFFVLEDAVLHGFDPSPTLAGELLWTIWRSRRGDFGVVEHPSSTLSAPGSSRL